jgi:hypothetical protein
MLLEQQAMQFQGTRRLIHLGYGNFRSDHQTLERLLLRLNASHGYLDGPQREHTWGSGWLPEAVAALASKDP